MKTPPGQSKPACKALCRAAILRECPAALKPSASWAYVIGRAGQVRNYPASFYLDVKHLKKIVDNFSRL